MSLRDSIERMTASLDRIAVGLERANRGPSLATGPAKRMTAASHNEAATDIQAAEDVIEPSRAEPSRKWYGGPTTEDVQEHRLCVITPERSSYIRPTGKPGRYEHVWTDGSVTPSAFSDGGINECLKSPGWSMAYEPTAREAIGLPRMSELDHCRE